MSSSRISILHCFRAPVGGLFRHVCDLALEQSRRGYDVGVLCDATTADALTEAKLAELADVLSLGVHRARMSRHISHRDFSGYAAARRLAETLDVDVLHGHGAKGGTYARLAAARLRRRGRQVVALYTPHGGSLHYSPGTAKGALFLGLERLLLRITDGLIFESAFASRTFSELIATPPCEVSIIPNGLRPDDFGLHDPKPDVSDFLFIGELRNLKGVDVLLRALAQLPDRNACLTVVGDGPNRANFQTLASALGLEGRVTFTGAQPAAQMFNSGRVLVVPSRAESFPYIVLEAAARGVPFIATDVGGIPEMVQHTPVALIPPDDVDALQARLDHALTHGPALVNAAEMMKARVAAEYTVERMTDRVLASYQSARAGLLQLTPDTLAAGKPDTSETDVVA